MAIMAMTEEEFIGRYEVSSAFECDGHLPDYDHFREALPDAEKVWSSADGDYAVHIVTDEDWDPPTSLLEHGGKVVGFYAGGEVWIENAHRGKKLSTPLILALIDQFEGPAHDNSNITAFSPSGLAAHRRAYREAEKIAPAAKP